MADRVVTSTVHPDPAIEGVGRFWRYRARLIRRGPEAWEVVAEYLNDADVWVWNVGDEIRFPTRDQAVAFAHDVLDSLALVPSSEVVQERGVSGE